MHQHLPQLAVFAISLAWPHYCAKFIPKFSDVSAPLRELTKKDKQFHWSEQQEQSLQQISLVLKSWHTLTLVKN